jgi:hypothetical protein
VLHSVEREHKILDYLQGHQVFSSFLSFFNVSTQGIFYNFFLIEAMEVSPVCSRF